MKLVTANAQLRSEIRNVQSQLKSAIQNHQMILFKLKDRPVSITLRVQMTSVQRHIVSLGEKQKKLLQELRKEIEASGGLFKAEQKPSIKALQNLRPNPINQVIPSKPHKLTKEPLIKKEYVDADEVIPDPVKTAVVAKSSRRKSKLVATPDEVLKNGNGASSPSPSQKENTPSTTPSSSPTHAANLNKLTNDPKQDSVPPSSASDESQDTFIQLPVDPEHLQKLQFMTALSLVTREVLTELQNRRTERKRRSCCSPQSLNGTVTNLKRLRPLRLSNSTAGAATAMDTTMSSKTDDKTQENLMCVSCSASNGTLNQCTICLQNFHWSCVFGDDVILSSGQTVRCKACQNAEIPKSVKDKTK